MLEILCTLETEAMLTYLVKRYNSLYRSISSNDTVEIKVAGVDIDTLLQKTLSREVGVIMPNSSLLLDLWSQRFEIDTLAREITCFAISPLIIGMKHETASALGFPERSLGWIDLLKQVHENIHLRWAHASIQSESGLLCVLAMFYVGAKKSDTLTNEDIQSEKVQSFIQLMEKTVQEYGASDYDILSRAYFNGKWRIDACVVLEQAILQFPQAELSDNAVLIFPHEGTLWADYPLTLLANGELNELELASYQSFKEYLLSSDAQALLLRFGFRPAGPQSSGYFAQKIRASSDAFTKYRLRVATFDHPQAVVAHMAAKEWSYSKRRVKVVLVTDVSGSMKGEKLIKVQDGLLSFVNQFESEDEEVGIITFSSEVIKAVPLGRLSLNRPLIENQITALVAHDRTALFDAINVAYDELQRQHSRGQIHAIIVMTDGLDNASKITLDNLIPKLRDSNRFGNEVAIFCIAYGYDADSKVLDQIASATGGDMVIGNPDNIKIVYNRVSKLF